MNAYMPYLWIGVVICAGIAEAIGKKLIAVWAMPGGIVASLLAFLHVPVWGQIPAFLLVSFAGCFLFIFLSSRKGGKGMTRNAGAEDLIGASGTVVEAIDNLAGCGLVSIGGEGWAARVLEYDGTLDAGTAVTVVAVEGVRVICRPA